MKAIGRVGRRILDIFAKAVYHEYPVYDDEGRVIGTELYTVHIGKVTRVIGKDIPRDQQQQGEPSLSGRGGGPDPC